MSNKRLNSFILPDNIIKKMKDDVQESRTIDREIGFNLCTNDTRLHDESYCIGDQCSVDIAKGCSNGRHVGLFHTHPHTNSEPSIQDIANAYQIGINCIGSTEEKDIKCYIRKETDYKRENLEDIIAALVRYEEPLGISEFLDLDNFEKWIKVRNDLKKKYLNIEKV